MKKAISLILALMLCVSIAVPAFAADSDFVIENGVLTKYKGPGGAVTIPSGVTGIEAGAFYGCDSLTSVTIPNSVTRIGEVAFAFCPGLISVTIPDSVTSIGLAAFNSCRSLTSVRIPDSVTSIGDNAFTGCGNLTSVIISNSVTSIGYGVFASCGLTSVTIPNSVTSIGDSAFQGCPGLTDIYYGGSEAQWKAIHFGTNWDAKDWRDIPEKLTYTVHYNSAAPAKSAVSVTVNGKAVEWTDAAPFIDKNNRTMVPLRAVADAMGLTVDWDGAAREAVFSNGSKTIYFPIGSTTARTGDGGKVKMDTAAVIVNSRTYAPIRYLAEYFGYEVGWDGATKTVSLK